MSNVEISIRFRRKSCNYLLTMSFLNILIYDLFNKIL